MKLRTIAPAVSWVLKNLSINPTLDRATFVLGINIYVLYLTNLQLGTAKSSVTMCIHSDTFFCKELLEVVDSYKS